MEQISRASLNGLKFPQISEGKPDTTVRKRKKIQELRQIRSPEPKG
jgi:hypothetical protein